MSNNRQILGLQSKRMGEIFETWIADSCDTYYREDVALIEKTPEPMRPIKPYDRRKGTFVAVYTKAAQPDFKGCLKSGQCIVFEAKHTDSDRIRQEAVTEEQSREFNRYEKMGAVCFVLVSLGLEDFYRVPWDIWKDMKVLFGHKYMDRTNLMTYRVRTEGTTIRFLEESR